MPITLVLSGAMTGNLPLAWLLSACAEAHLLTVLGTSLSAVYRIP